MIVSIEQVGKGKYMITDETRGFVCLYYREMKGLDFEVGKACTVEQWAIAKKSVVTRGKKRVFHLLARKDYTEHEITTKLVKEHYDGDDVQYILDYFKGLGYIDDSNYVIKYYKCYKESRSKRVIEQKLKLKGISNEMLKDVLMEEVGEDDAYNAAKRQAVKKYGGKELSRDNYPKMIQFLMRKGFDYGLCKQVIGEIFDSQSENH